MNPKRLQPASFFTKNMVKHPTYPIARKLLISHLKQEGFRVHPDEVYCPTGGHCWVDVAALKEHDYWAFEYKSRSDSIKRGLSQCASYSTAFNYVVLVANRNRATSSPYFKKFKQNGFGVWSHTPFGFQTLIKASRRGVAKRSRAVIERQFGHVLMTENQNLDRKISEWFPSDRNGPRLPLSL